MNSSNYFEAPQKEVLLVHGDAVRNIQNKSGIMTGCKSFRKLPMPLTSQLVIEAFPQLP